MRHFKRFTSSVGITTDSVEMSKVLRERLRFYWDLGVGQLKFSSWWKETRRITWQMSSKNSSWKTKADISTLPSDFEPAPSLKPRLSVRSRPCWRQPPVKCWTTSCHGGRLSALTLWRRKVSGCSEKPPTGWSCVSQAAPYRGGLNTGPG